MRSNSAEMLLRLTLCKPTAKPSGVWRRTPTSSNCPRNDWTEETRADRRQSRCIFKWQQRVRQMMLRLHHGEVSLTETVERHSSAGSSDASGSAGRASTRCRRAPSLTSCARTGPIRRPSATTTRSSSPEMIADRIRSAERLAFRS